jgi:lysozyme
MAVDRAAMTRQLRLHEGERLKPYRCTAGKLTIGVGRNLEDRGITAQESDMLLANDIAREEAELMRALPWVGQLDDVRQRVLLDMSFNLGLAGLLGFKNTLAAIQAGDYQRGATMMLDSRWARQVGTRAERLSRMMATGKDPRELWPAG